MNHNTVIKDPLAMAKEGLEKSKQDLVEQIKMVDAKMESLQNEQPYAAQALQLAESRLAVAVSLADKLCLECTNVIPLLTMNADRLEAFKFGDSNNNNNNGTNNPLCIACNQSLMHATTSLTVDMPPKHDLSLHMAKHALSYAQSVLQSLEMTSPHLIDNDHNNKSNTTKRSGEDSGRSGLLVEETYDSNDEDGGGYASDQAVEFGVASRYKRRKVYSTTTTKPVCLPAARRDLVGLAQASVDHAKHLCESIPAAMQQWTQHRGALVAQMEHVEMARVQLYDRARKVLKDKLDLVSGDGEPTNGCIICQERNKDTVFQCGHQSCA